MTDSPPGLDLEKLLPWFRERVAPVDGLDAEIIGHGEGFVHRTLKGAASIAQWKER